MKKILFSISLLIAFALFLTFHDKGNEYLKPYLSAYLESKAKKRVEVEVEHLKIDYNYIEVTAKVNRLSRLNAYGDYDLLNKTINLNYNLTSNGFKSKKFSFNNKIDVNGTVKGLFKNLDVTGKGLALDSNLNYKFKVKDKLVKNIEIHLIKTDIAQLLLLTAQPAYAKGKIDVDIDIPTLKGNKTVGKAYILLHDIKINEKVLKKEFKIELPKNTTVTAKINSTIEADLVKFNADINSNLLTLKLNNAYYNLKEKELVANYNLLVPKLSKFNRLVGKNLQGKMTVNGEIKADKKLYLRGKTTSFDGIIDFTLQDKQLTSTIKDVSVQKLMYTLAYPQIFKAYIIGNFDYNLATEQGNLHSKLNKAQLLPNSSTDLVKQIRGIDLTRERYTETDFNAKLNRSLINFNFDAKSKTVHISIPNGQIDKKSNTINANYKLIVENKDILGKIKGNISKPKITIDGSKFIKERIFDRIKDEIGIERLEDLEKDLGIGKEEKDMIKSVLKNIFK